MRPSEFVDWVYIYASRHDVNDFINISKLFDEQVYLFVLKEDEKVEWLTPIKFEPFVNSITGDWKWGVEVDMNDMNYDDCILCDVMSAIFGMSLISLFVYLLLIK